MENIELDALDRKLFENFAGKVVRKDLVHKMKSGINVPIYVLEYLLGKYCPRTAIFTGFWAENEESEILQKFY